MCGFGQSPLIHVMLMHLGQFVHKHKFIGAVSEEGLEALHSKIAYEINRHKMSTENRLKNALKWVAIDTLLSDAGKLTC